MMQLLAGTAYLHDQWVLHRDLKTSNILVNGIVSLLDCLLGCGLFGVRADLWMLYRSPATLEFGSA